MPKDLYSIRVDPEMTRWLDSVAAEEGRSRNDVIRRLLAEARAAREKQQDTQE